MESPDQQPEQLVPDSEAYLGTWTKSDLKLLAEYEVLEEETAPAAQAPLERGEQESEEYEHQPRIADLRIRTRRHARTDFCPPTGSGARRHPLQEPQRFPDECRDVSRLT